MAVLDSGSADVPDLDGAHGQSRVVAFVDFVNHRRQMYDDGGHGTFVDGLIAGNGASSLPTDQGGNATTQYRGVAPDANIISLKVLDSHGQGRASSLIAAIGWAIAHRQQYNIRVMNISVEGDVTCPAAYDPLDRAVDAAWRAGIVVVCAAGNEGAFGEGGILSPGNDPYAITVGASDTQQTAGTSDDTVCSYSSIGPTLYDEYAKPDLVAPGNHLVSLRAPGSWIDVTYPQTRVAVSTYVPGASSRLPSAYAVMSGTSASAPVVAGAVALMVQKDPSLTPGDVKLRLMDSAHALAGASSYAEGAGELDVAAALTDPATTAGYDLSAKLGNGSTILPPDVLLQWQKYAWSKYAWSKYAWSKYACVVEIRVVQVRMVKVRMVGRDQRAVTQEQAHQGRPVTAARPRAAVTLYVALTLLAAAACSLAAYSMHHEVELGGLIAFIALSTVTDLREVRLPVIGHVTLSFVPVLAALIVFGLWPAILVATASGLATVTVTRDPKKVVFNVGDYVVSTFVAGLFYLAFVPASPAFVQTVLPAFAATGADFLVNTVVLAGVIALSSGGRPWSIWHENYQWGLPSYMTGATLSLLLAWLYLWLGLPGLVLGVPPLFLIWYSYDVYAGRMRDRATHLERGRLVSRRARRRRPLAGRAARRAAPRGGRDRAGAQHSGRPAAAPRPRGAAASSWPTASSS